MDLQSLFNIAARKGKASSIFVPPQQQPSFIETVTRQPQRASTIFIPRTEMPSYLETAAQQPQQASTVFIPRKQMPSFLDTAAGAAGVSPLFKFPKADKKPQQKTQAPAVVAPVAIPAGVVQPNAIVKGLAPTGEVDRTKSDVYKQYAQTPAAQFERYFQTPEMTPYFGGAFQGKGAPTSAQAMIDLASQTAAPTTAPLASFYAAQSATGRGSMDEIISAMGYKGTPMEQWAKANPMLAFREFNKKFPAGALTQGPTPALPGPPMGEGDTAGQRALEAAQYQLSGDEQASVGQRTANFLAGVGNPVTPTEALNQGAAVDANRGAESLREAQKTKTQGYQQFLPTAQPLF